MKTKQKKLILFLILILTLLTQASCSNSSNSANACPTPSAGTKLLTDAEGGYCLIYPAEYSTDVAHFIVINPVSGPGDVLGDAWLYVEITDASGRSAAQIADEAIDSLPEGFNITRSEVDVDGEQAVVIDGLPAQDSARYVFIVHDGRFYNLVFMPWYPNAAEPTQLENLYAMVMDTFHFLPRE